MIFEIYTDQSNEYFFRLADENGDLLLLSEAYKEKEKIFDAINSVKKNVRTPTGIAKDETEEGDYFFLVIGSDGRIICKSAMFYSTANRDKWINDIQQIVPQLEVIEI